MSPMRSAIIPVIITKSDNRAARVRFVNQEYDYKVTELDDTKSSYELIIKNTISEKRRRAKS